MEEIRKRASVRTQRLDGEVVGRYCPEAEEVVGVYARPYPAAAEEPVPAVRRRRKKTGLWIFLACMVVLAGVCLAAFFLWEKEPPRDRPGSWEDLPGAGEKFTGIKIPLWPAGDVRMELMPSGGRVLTPQEVYAKASPAVVTVMVDVVGGGGSVGTGVIFTEDGYMLTNYHVVEGGYRCEVALWDNSTRSAWYVAGDPDNDIAVLKIEDGSPLHWMEMGDPEELSVGDPVYAIGSPLGIELRGTFTDGIVSALNRDVELEDRTMILLQTNTALNTGNSGGPLINAAGQVVGINTIKMMSDYSTVEGLGFAIPADRVQRIVNQLLETGEVPPQPLLGVTVELLGECLPDGTVGARVVEVVAGSASEAAGVLAEDIIVSIGGEPVRGSGDVLRIRERFAVGQEMPVRIWRGGEYLDVVLQLQQAAE